MDVEVRDFLMAVEAGVGEQTVAGGDEPLVARDLAHRADETRDLGLAAPRGEIVPAHIGALGDHEDMQGRLRVDVVERERILVLVNRLRRQFAAQDAREDIAVVIGKRRVDRHGESSYCRRPAFSVWPEVPWRRSSSAAMSSHDRPRSASRLVRWKPRSDRKSTRLNYSH